MDWSLVGCTHCFVPPAVMSSAFDALRIVCFWAGESVTRSVVISSGCVVCLVRVFSGLPPCAGYFRQFS